MRDRVARGATVVSIVGLMLGTSGAAANQDRPHYVRPGAPGEPTVRISPRDLVPAWSYPHTHHEVHFLQHMIPHHGQAIVMSGLVPDRAGDERVRSFARRIDVAQASEIDIMSQWLEHRGEDVPDPFHWHGHEGMPGMISEEQLAELEASEGREFDVRFLEAMIEHHQGAVTMVLELEEATNGVLEPDISSLAIEIVDLQETEIKRMQLLLDELGD